MGVLFFCSFHVAAQNWQDKQWLRLLVYRETITGFESEADDQNFFVHPEGKFSPEKELKAFIKSLDDQETDPNKNSFCRFPARVKWLRKFRPVPESPIQCEDYEKFRNRLSAKSISVVFSSYYLNNPASSFGHTFIRLGKQTNEMRDEDSTATELLDTGINYGAVTEGAGPVVFAIGGLAGWFSGNYNAVPYYYKVREYNDFETRDLWSYQLNMTQEEIDLIVDHIWELGHTRFDYFFLTENCSYHVLSILESARPSLKLHERLPSLYTIPSITLKALQDENLIRKVTFRPAPSTQFYHQINLLNPDEKKAMNELFFEQKHTNEFSPERRALIYDTAISLVDYKYAEDVLKGEEKAQNIKRPLLIARSKIPVRSEELSYFDKFSEAPHLGHDQKRLSLGFINDNDRNYLEAEWRFAFHDILDNDIGYPPKTRLEVMKAVVRTDGEDHQLRDFSVVDVMKIGNWDIYDRSMTWKVKLGQWQTRRDNQDLTTLGVKGGYGIGTELGPFSPYILAHVESSYVTEELFKYKLGLGGDLGILTEIGNALKMHTVLEGRFDPWNESTFLNELRYSNRSFGIGGYHQVYLIDGVQETGLKVFKYL